MYIYIYFWQFEAGLCFALWCCQNIAEAQKDANNKKPLKLKVFHIEYR